MDKILLCDIDGVLNALCDGTPPRHSTQWMGEWGRFEVLRTENPSMFTHQPEGVERYQINFSRELLAQMESWSRFTNTRFVWLTTWEQHAVEVFCERAGFEFGKQWDVLFDPRQAGGWDGSYEWWKMRHAKALLVEEPGAQIIWVDDDLIVYNRDKWMVEKSTNQERGFFAIAPNPRIGAPRFAANLIENILADEVPRSGFAECL